MEETRKEFEEKKNSIIEKYGKDCPNCDNTGSYGKPIPPKCEEVEQIQCEYCYTVVDSKFNLKLNLDELWSWFETKLKELQEKIDDYDHLFDLQMKRMAEARKLWQEKTKRYKTHPDLGELLTFLLNELKEEREKNETENKILRILLWINHGHDNDLGALYGDDGEMQCAVCKIDFKRASPQEILDMWEKRAIEKIKNQKHLND